MENQGSRFIAYTAVHVHHEMTYRCKIYQSCLFYVQLKLTRKNTKPCVSEWNCKSLYAQRCNPYHVNEVVEMMKSVRHECITTISQINKLIQCLSLPESERVKLNHGSFPDSSPLQMQIRVLYNGNLLFVEATQQ